MLHYLLSFTYYRISPPLAAAAASVIASATVGAAAAAVSAAAVSIDAFATAAVLAAATIAISAAIAAAFWLIVVCPRRCLCFRLPPPFLPAPAIATAAVCRRHCQFRHHHNRRPCSFSVTLSTYFCTYFIYLPLGKALSEAQSPM
jgi:hypothetical protein